MSIREWPLKAIQGDEILAATFVSVVAAHGANEGGLRLACILVGFPPCDGCGFVVKHCRCKVPR